VVVPLVPGTGWTECLVARGVADAIVSHDRARFTTRLSKAGREDKILIDDLPNVTLSMRRAVAAAQWRR
jgi:DNA primase